MRNQNDMLNSFMPISEKEWESRLFIDSAIKDKSEYALEAIARALSGRYDISLKYASADKPFEYKQHIAGDNEQWITVTKKYPIEAKMREFYFYGRSRTEIWVKIIEFWAVNTTIFPCGGASFPNIAHSIQEASKQAKEAQ